MWAIWMMADEGGWGALIALGMGALGVLAGIIAIVALALSRKAGHIAGIITLFFALAAPAFGLVGMVWGQRATVQALKTEAVGPGSQKRLLHEGLREAQSSAKVGLYAGLLPLILGGAAALFGARRKEDERSSGLRWAIGGAATAIAIFTSLGALAASKKSLPPDIGAAEAKLLDARDRAKVDLERGCHDLEKTLKDDFWKPKTRDESPRSFTPDPRATLDDFDALATRCARDRFDAIKLGAPAPGRLAPTTYDALLESPLLVDDALKREIEAARDKPRALPDSSATGPGIFGLLRRDAGEPGDIGAGSTIGTAGTGRTSSRPSAVGGATTVSGRLPPDVIQRIIRQHMNEFRSCYEQGLAKNPKLEGKVTLKFVIGSDGLVSSATDGPSDLPDRSVVQCCVRRTQAIAFPKPEGGGIVTVTYPLIFRPN